jgi:excinuclease UvrABC ATPase subunit
MADRLVVRGAREHNLRDVSLDLLQDEISELGAAIPG